MRPLTDFAHQADLIEADGAQFEDPTGTVRSTELVPLARALHSLVSRLQRAFRRERRFLSDAAHELKTAVAIQKSTLQLLEQGKASEEELREGIARALEDTSRTENLVANMLLLASIDYFQRSTGKGAIDNEAPLGLNESLQHRSACAHGEDQIGIGCVRFLLRFESARTGIRAQPTLDQSPRKCNSAFPARR